jgi:penicillin-binding protein 1C
MNHLRKSLFILLSTLAGSVILFFLLNFVFPLPDPKPYSLVVEDRHGHLLSAFRAGDGIWRIRTSPDEIPQKLRSILIRKEDRYFRWHPGVNPFSVVRALVTNIATGRRVSGASTITMQVARMMEPKPRTYGGKLREMFRAFQLELKYSKNEILEMYLSMVPLGGNIEGIKSASLIYYQTPPERLNIAQLFDLILIPNDPNDLRPDRNADRLYRERLRQARPLITAGFFGQRDSTILWQTPAAASRRQLPRLAPHFCQRMKDEAGSQAPPLITSSIDLRLQNTVETLLSNHLLPWKARGVGNGAVIVIDNRTHEVMAYAGSEDFSDAIHQGQVDAVRALRSPGSTLKPFLYACQMERGLLTPKSRLLDVPYDQEGFLAENYDGTYSGQVYADEALKRSLNVPMVRMLRQATVPVFVSFLSELGFNSLRPQKEKLGLSLILGGCGITLEELTAAYSTFPAGGKYFAPSFVRTSSTRTQFTQPFSASTAYMVTEILKGLDRPDLPNNFESSVTLPLVAFKTGTSYGRRDAWSVGYSAEYTVGVWIGNVDDHGNPDLTGSKAAAPLLIDIFNTISTSSQKSILPQPDDVQIRQVCANSGLLPTTRCRHLIDDIYSVRRTVTRFCETDRELLTSEDGKVRYCPNCLGTQRYHVSSYEEYPKELLSYWSSIGKPLPSLPAHNPDCTGFSALEGPSIISPTDGMTYYCVSPKQELVLQASSGLGVAANYWYIDNRFYGRGKPNTKYFVALSNGTHTITCVDDRGRTTTVTILVRALT